MLKKIKIIHFKSIQNMDLNFVGNTNIYGANGVGKTNILHAICYLFQNHIGTHHSDFFIKNGENEVFLEGIFLNQYGLENKVTFFYNSTQNKKQITLNGKKVTKKILHENILKILYFGPLSMNLFYLGPKYRRDFLDHIITNQNSQYPQILKKYETLLKNRNKVLKNIGEGLSSKQEIDFWNHEFIHICEIIYTHRFLISNYFKNHIHSCSSFFSEDKNSLSFDYITKVDEQNIKESISEYLTKNFERDIILGKTHIGPHIDDFNISINSIPIIEYASRGEMKSVILEMYHIANNYIFSHTKQSPIFLIDDIGSELDSKHIDDILHKLSSIQLISTSISALERGNISNILI